MCPIETCIMNDTLLRTNTRSSFCIQIYKPINSTVYNLISYDSKDLVILYFICSISINSKVSEDYCHTFKINCILKSWFCFNKESNYDILNKWTSLIGKGNSIKKVLDLVKNREPYNTNFVLFYANNECTRLTGSHTTSHILPYNNSFKQSYNTITSRSFATGIRGYCRL